MKIILIGCGALTGIFILGLGSCAGVMYFAYKGTDSVAAVGAEYLRKSTKVQDAFGPPVTVERHKFGWSVHVVNDGGNARISYDVRGTHVSAPFDAVVWLVRTNGSWHALGAQVQTPDGYSITLGKPPEPKKINWD